MLLKDYDAAGQALERAVSEAPQGASYVLNLADIRRLQGLAEQAEELYRRVLELIDEDAAQAQSITVRAQALAHLGQKMDAVRAIQEALLKAPQDGNIAFEAAVVYSIVGDEYSAFVHAEQAVKLGYRDRNWFTLPWFDRLYRNNAEFAKLVAEL